MVTGLPSPDTAQKGGDERREPPEAFPYRPPDPALRERYREIFALTEPVEDRWAKLALDKIVGVGAVAAALPVLGTLFIGHLLEGVLVPEHRGSFVTGYRAVSRGAIFIKYKIRVVKECAEDASRRGEWQPHEWSSASRTYVGRIAKKFYFDELPQLLSVLRGDISLVGPRPLAVHHYERDLAQGNVTRKLIRAGLVGPTQALKGTPEFGAPGVEYAYVEKVMRLSSLRLVLHDLKIVLQCTKVMREAKGL